MNSPENGPVGPKQVDTRRYMNKIEIVTSVGFSFHILQFQLVLNEQFRSRFTQGINTMQHVAKDEYFSSRRIAMAKAAFQQEEGSFY